MCDNNCACILCLELNGSERQVIKKAMGASENFILLRSTENISAPEPKKYTFFGIEDAHTLQKRFDQKIDENNNNEAPIEARHKSIIYVSTTLDKYDLDGSREDRESKIVRTEIIDEFMSLSTTENSGVVVVIFKGTFAFATQLVNEITLCCQIYYHSSDDEDDFPLGMEADYLTRTSCYYLRKKW